MQPVVDLVGNERDTGLLAGFAQRLQRRAGQHRPRRVGRPRHDQPVEARHVARHGLQPRLHGRAEGHGRQPQRLQDMPVRRVAGQPQAHPRPGVEERREGQQERPRGAGRHHHPGGVEVDPVALAVMARDPGAEFRQAQGHGVAERPRGHVRRQPLQGLGRRAGAGLAHFHVNDMGARRLGSPRPLHHVHHDEGIDVAPVREPPCGCHTCPLGVLPD